jgi:glycosyltransferase involved in cell wall biosynthesis
MSDQNELRILQLCASNSSSGAENHIVSLSNGLAQRGHSVKVVTPPGGWLADALVAKGVPVRTMKLKDLDYWISIVKLAAMVRSEKVDILHAHLSRAACIAHAVGRLTRVPVVTTAHVRNAARIYKRLARRQNRLIAVSNYVAQMLVENGVPQNYIATIYHGTNFASIPVQGTPAEIKAEFGIPESRQLIGLVGKICRDKGQLELVRALDTLTDTQPNAHLILVGRSDPKYEAALRQEITSLGLKDKVTIAGERNDIPRLIDSFTVCALPSYMETFGLAALEASARGKAVVATRNGALPEVVRDGETGVLVDLNPSALSDALNALLSDPESREEMGRRGREMVESEFTIEAMIDRTEWVYRNALEP